MRIVLKNDMFSTNSIIILFLLFLGALNFVGRYSIWFLLAFVFMFLVKKVKVKLNIQISCLFFFSVFCIIFSDSVSLSIKGLVIQFIFLMCYIVGYNFVEKHDSIEIQERKLGIVLKILMLGNVIHFLLNLFINLNSITTRNTIDFWTGQVMSATGQSVLACLAIAIGCAVIFSDCKYKTKFMSCSILVFVIFYNFILAGRAIFAMLIIVFILAYMNYLILGKNKKIRKLAGVILFCSILIIAYEQNFMNLKSMIEQSNFYNRFWNSYTTENILEDGRLSLKAEYIKQFLEHPWGGNYSKNDIGFYAHDLLLDIYDDAGILAFVVMTGYVMSTMMNLFRTMKSKHLNFFTKQVVLCVYIAIYIEFFLEPIIAGVPWLLAEFCLIDGLVFHILCKSKRNGECIYADCRN